MTYSIYIGCKCYVSGLTYEEASKLCVSDERFTNKECEICEDNGVVNDEED